ncbi:serine/threonine-protein kinase Sgk2 isoform beta [Reticulomyxa filosa]|uniref:Serine/threonine-protein kinase Sgk2 isoform beta n=1 Tax=Reticulomyxa filosa TaxID=46433 RepID=X6NWY8_RETFI|nr:serine/threonine-protein kinase Sgk2 isoform beta [Reticulomyxa filosa]|eukprot:ETO30835.1 serine/threonine-protein kinase Sgk2 isoform beta [Reticulomyxa filosa]
MNLRYAFQTEAKLYFVLDFYQGGELFFHLRKVKRFTEPQARFLVAEVGCALGHLHSLDIAYRDLKPENILLASTGHICLTDFGLAKELGGDRSKTFCGTPEYLGKRHKKKKKKTGGRRRIDAPEIITNEGHGLSVDWWSYGILLYELTVGIPPFYDQDANMMYKKIQTAILQIPSTLSNTCCDLIVQVFCCCSGKDDFKEIQAHEFWENLDWKKLLAKEIDPPYKPQINGNDTDVTNFAQAFLRQQPVDSFVAAPAVPSGETDGFENFTYCPKHESILEVTK